MHSAKQTDLIWHIFKKDVRLLWPWALALAIAQAASATLAVVLGHFGGPFELNVIAYYFPFLVLLGLVVLTIAVVHQDPLSGLRQDWLVRPIHRRDLLLAKTVFVLLIIHAPVLILDVLEQLALHLPLLGSLGSAAARGITLLCALTLPALLLGAVTASLTEALLFGLLVSIGCTVAYVGAFLIILKPPSLASGVYWLGPVCADVVIVIGAALTLAFVYSRRRLLTARFLGVAVVLLALGASAWMPFNLAFAIQQQLSRSSGEQEGISIRFEPSHTPVAQERRAAAALDSAAVRGASTADGAASGLPSINRSNALLRLPLRVSGLPRHSILWADRVSLRLIGSDGTTLYRGTGICERFGVGMGRVCREYSLEVRESGSEGSSTPVEQELNLPTAVYARFKDRPAALELTYSLTLLTQGSTQTMGTTNDIRSLPALGSCATRIDSDGDELELRCLSTTVPPSCATLVLEDLRSATQNPQVHLCMPNYSPFPLNIRDVLNRFGTSLAFRDPSGLAHYPVDGARVQGARVSLVTHHATDHFRRELLIRDIRLADWVDPIPESRLSSAGN
jgi:hypothetical protein